MKMNLPPNYNDDEESTFSTLSANAHPFHPTETCVDMHMHEPINIAIYNDGVPSMTLSSEKDRFDILHGIEDQALDDEFPPDAGEAAELEAAEAFVIEMVNLAILEEREERARSGFVHIQKRWEVRRAAGPSGRPRPAMNLIVPANHAPKHSNVKSLVPFSHQSQRTVVHEARMRNESQRIEPRHTKNSSMNHRPIIQPRKQN